MLALATALAVGGLAVQPQVAEAARPKVVIVVGPTGSLTSSFKRAANEVAAQARNLGANVVKVYSPYATWGAVRSKARGANLFVYLGHGNGWPSPYKPFQTRTKNGMGLNSRAGAGNHNHTYYGESHVRSGIQLAPNAAVLLMKLCYASGNPEWGRSAPTRSVAKQRVDNYGAGFLRAGARVVFAETLGKANYVLNGLFKTNRTMTEIFWSAPNAVRSHRIGPFVATRSPSWAKVIMDPNPRIRGMYWRSIVGDLSMRAGEWR
ncbi:MAG TPA: hypothetical protein VMP67_06985 [Candidatus Limnocylindria bacterium]|nr:hypothetical protein [Candidatus Limnocylindria bacterium]